MTNCAMPEHIVEALHALAEIAGRRVLRAYSRATEGDLCRAETDLCQAEQYIASMREIIATEALRNRSHTPHSNSNRPRKRAGGQPDDMPEPSTAAGTP